MANKRRRSSSSSSESSASSSDEDERIQTKNKQVDSTSSSESDEDWNAKKKQVTKSRSTTNKQPAKKQAKTIVEEESDNESEDEREEGEVEDDDDEFNDGYDENLMGDEEDQKRLLMMTEKEREQELFNRSEKREVLKTRFEIEKKLRLAKKKEQSKITFTDANLRSTDRRKALENNRKQKDGLKQLKEQREKRKQKAKLRASDVYSSSDDDSDNERNNRRKSSSSSSESSSDESSDDERRRKDSDDDDRGDVEETPFDLDTKTMNSIRLSRFKMSQWCHTPFFKDTVIGCFVRLSVGMKDGKQVYRIAEITDVTDGPTAYDLEKTKTDKLVKCKHGREEKNFRIQFVSNTEFNEQEFKDWKTKMERDRLSLPNRKQIDEKLKHIHLALNYNFKDSDIEAIVREKEKYAQQPVNFALKKTQLKKEKDQAEQNGDLARVNELTEQLDELEQKAKDLDYKRTQKISAISYINERNRMRNIVESEKAILAAREEGLLNQVDDPFTRRKCAPMLVSMKKNKPGDDKAANESKDEVDRALMKGNDQNSTQKNGLSSQQKSSSTGISNNSSTSAADNNKTEADQNNDLFSAHDFDIQIDFDITSNLTSTSSNNTISNSLYTSNLSCSSIASNKSTNRRSLNLEEYKKKKGLI